MRAGTPTRASRLSSLKRQRDKRRGGVGGLVVRALDRDMGYSVGGGVGGSGRVVRTLDQHMGYRAGNRP